METPSKDGDTRITGEHFLGIAETTSNATPNNEPGFGASGRRIADLTSQIDFLDQEVNRYRQQLEAERLRHATTLADATLAADTAADDLRRRERQTVERLNASHRSVLAASQIEFDRALSQATSAHATELATERARHEQIVEHERARRDVEVETTRQRVIDELYESHTRAYNELTHEATQLREANTRLRAEVAELAPQLKASRARAKDLATKLQLTSKRLAVAEEQRATSVKDLEAQVAVAERRIVAERERSAATLAELLEQSAVLAADADKARADFAAEQAAAGRDAATAHQRAQYEHEALAEAAADRAQRMARREIELEAEIARLRAELGQ